MHNSNKGFTILELLIVIAIIGLLAVVVVASARSNRQKANITAFKSEVTSAYNTWSALCVSDNLTANADTKNTTWGAMNQNCGVDGNGTFSLVATSIPEQACTANIDQSGITYSLGCN